MSFTSRSQCLRQDYYVVWLDENDKSYRNSLIELQQVIDTVDLFIDIDECIDSITDRPDEIVYMIVSEKYVQQLSLVIGDISQVKSIYIFYQNIASICDHLKQMLRDDHTNEVSINFAKSTPSTSSKNKDTLDCTFMYTQILKEILLSINFDEQHFNDFLIFCRDEFKGNTRELRNIDEIQKDYRNKTPIWWYTRETFLYKILNKALRFMDIDIILQMGFFVCDLHKQIAVLHAEQFTEHTSSNSFVVYRGQGLSQADFDQMKQTKGGLLAFNNFLSTSKQRDVSLRFLRPITTKRDLVPVLFVMNINPTIKHTLFANIRDISEKKSEDEILFSMHSVFRIGHIERFDEDNAIWKVELIFTSDNDPELYLLTKRMREEIQGETGRERLGNLMIKLKKFDQAEKLYQSLLRETTDQYEKVYCFYQLAIVYCYQGKYEEAAEYNQKSHEFCKKRLSVDHPSLATSYGNIGCVYQNNGEFAKAREYFHKSLEMRTRSLPVDHPHLAVSYDHIGSAYHSIRDYSKALEYYRQSLEIREKIFPVDHPDLATSYNNIGMVYNRLTEYQKALEYNHKSLEIIKKTLPVDHPDLGISYNNIGMVYASMGEYSKALEYFESSLEIRKKSLRVDHPDLATPYNNIGMVYQNTGDDSKALKYYHKSLEIMEKTLPSNHWKIKGIKEKIEILREKL